MKSITTELLEQHPEYFEGEVNTLPSETIPGQAMSAKEAVMRADRGLPVTGVGDASAMPYDGYQKHSASGVYEGESFDLDDMDIPVFSDEMDVIDFHEQLRKDFLSGFHARKQEKSDTTPPQEPGKATPSESSSPEPPMPANG